MKALWSWADKKHRTRLSPRVWNRLVVIDDKTGQRHQGGTVDHETGVLVDAQLAFDLTPGVAGVTIRFVRVYTDGRPDDGTGFQDFRRLPKARLYVCAKWSGQMDPSYALVIEERHERGYVTQDNTIYKGWE